MENKVKVFTIRYKNEIKFSEIPLLRGAVLNAIGEDVELLFHNHTEDGFRYAYPLIQYKRIKNNAAIVCVAEGVESISQFLFANQEELRLGDRTISLEVDSIMPKQNLVQTWDTEFRYSMRKWLALNSDNYQKYISIEECSEKIHLLERILIGNLLSFAKGLGIEIKKEITCKLISIGEARLMTVKNVKMMAFDVEFKTNISIPDYIGLGKHASIGYGMVVRKINID